MRTGRSLNKAFILHGIGNKKILDKASALSRTNHLIRVATLNSRITCSQQDTIMSSATDVCPHVAEYSVPKGTFDCTLSGPFDEMFLTCLSATQALCEGINAVISASTVYC